MKIVTRLNQWIKKVRALGRPKPKHRVLVADKHETLTGTQAVRFDELGRLRRKNGANPQAPGRKSHYSLQEACERMQSNKETLLRMAASGLLNCYVSAKGLKGCWQGVGSHGSASATPSERPTTRYLALSIESCRDIEAHRSTNVSILEHRHADGRKTFFHLQEPLWIDPDKLLLLDPLPSAKPPSN